MLIVNNKKPNTLQSRKILKIKDGANSQKPLLLWPGVVIVVLQWLVRFGIPIVIPEAAAFGVLGALFCGLAIVVWWLFFSRAPRLERWGAVILMIVTMIVTLQIIHESIGTGMRGIMFFVYSIPRKT